MADSLYGVSFKSAANLFVRKLTERAFEVSALPGYPIPKRSKRETLLAELAEEKRRTAAAQDASVARQNQEILKTFEVKPETGESIEDLMGS